MKISFKANYVDNATIKKYNKNKCENHSVVIVELDQKNENDVKSLKKTSKTWENHRTFASKIYEDFLFNHKFNQNCDDKVFALTEQKSNYEALEPKSILGLVKVSDKNSDPNVVYIDYLQTDPRHKTFANDRKYKKIGKALIDYIKTAYEKKTLILFPEFNSIGFHEKMGFKEDGLRMIFKK